jgi:hypothetical protein
MPVFAVTVFSGSMCIKLPSFRAQKIYASTAGIREICRAVPLIHSIESALGVYFEPFLAAVVRPATHWIGNQYEIEPAKSSGLRIQSLSVKLFPSPELAYEVVSNGLRLDARVYPPSELSCCLGCVQQVASVLVSSDSADSADEAFYLRLLEFQLQQLNGLFEEKQAKFWRLEQFRDVPDNNTRLHHLDWAIEAISRNIEWFYEWLPEPSVEFLGDDFLGRCGAFMTTQVSLLHGCGLLANFTIAFDLRGHALEFIGFLIERVDIGRQDFSGHVFLILGRHTRDEVHETTHLYCETRDRGNL